jgi:hypothetical protein
MQSEFEIQIGAAVRELVAADTAVRSAHAAFQSGQDGPGREALAQGVRDALNRLTEAKVSVAKIWVASQCVDPRDPEPEGVPRGKAAAKDDGKPGARPASRFHRIPGGGKKISGRFGGEPGNGAPDMSFVRVVRDGVGPIRQTGPERQRIHRERKDKSRWNPVERWAVDSETAGELSELMGRLSPGEFGGAAGNEGVSSPRRTYAARQVFVLEVHLGDFEDSPVIPQPDPLPLVRGGHGVRRGQLRRRSGRPSRRLRRVFARLGLAKPVAA